MTDAINGGQGQGQDEAKPAESDDEILVEARDRYRACETNESDNRREAKDDLLFLTGGVNQWDPTDAQIRQAQRRPMITVNNLPTFLHQVTNEHRQNKLGGRVSPVDDKADEETAEVIQGVIRHIEYDSNATVATITAVNSAAAIGFGYFRLVTEHESKTSFDQKISFKRIRNPLSVHIDPLSQEPDGSDQKFCFVDSLEDRAEFKRQYPKAKATNTSLIGQDIYKGWFAENTVLVCEYYRIKETEATLCQLQDGSTGWKDDLPKEMLPLIKRERQSTRCVVEWFKITGADVLEKTIIKCDWIPVFPVYGDEIDIEGKVVRQGIIRNSKDSFKMYNVCITTAIEEVATRAKSPYIMAEGQDEGHEAQWANINRIPYSSVKYKPTTVGDLLVPPPQRSPMADIPAGWLSMTMHFADNKKATTGLFDSSLGARGSATSGIQEREQQAQGDIANLHYSDNLKISYRHALRCIVSMIPHYYDGARIVRMIGEDEESKVVPINQEYQRTNPQTRAIETVMHDFTVGTFDVAVSAGPSYSTARQEAADFMVSAMQAAKDPATVSILTYAAMKNQDVPGAEEVTKMLKKTLPPGIAEPDPDEQAQEPIIQTPHGPMPASQVGPHIQQLGEALQNAHKEVETLNAGEQELKAREQQNQQAELQLKEKEIAIKEQEVQIKQFEAETARAEAEAETVKIQAEADAIRLKAEVEANCTHEESKAKAESIRMKADTEAVRSQAETVVPHPSPTGMQIKAPSGGVYDVTLVRPS